MTTTIKNLTNIEGSQYAWTVANDITETEQRYMTNKSGEGIFEIDDNGVRGKQITGTTQFTLSGCSKDGARKRIQRFFRD